MEPEDICLRRYRELRARKPEIFGNPSGCPTTILFEAGEIKRAQKDVLDERHAAGWITDDLRVGVLAEDPYIGHVIRDAVRFFDGKLGLYNRGGSSAALVALLPMRSKCCPLDWLFLSSASMRATASRRQSPRLRRGSSSGNWHCR